MALKDRASPVDSTALVARALRSLDVASVIQSPVRVRAKRRQPAHAPRSLKSALRMLLPHESSERRLKHVLGRLSEAMLEGVAVVRSDGQIVYANDNLCRMLGWSRAELVGKPCAEHLGGICKRPARERYEIELRTKAGRAIVVEVWSERVETGEGKSAGTVSVMIDITARAHALRQSESEVRLLSAQSMAAQELERQRIARELHDGVGQALSGVKFTLEGCEALLAEGAAYEVAHTLGALSTRIQAVIDEVRRVSMDLRPSTLDDLGILPTLGWFTREFRAIYGQIKVDTLVEAREEEIAPPMKTAIYRIVQEAFNNVVAHSGARRVSLALRRRGGQLELQVQDDGVGFDSRAPRTGRRRGGLGLQSMRERAEVTGGRFALRSENDRGTTITVAWPLYRRKGKK